MALPRHPDARRTRSAGCSPARSSARASPPSRRRSSTSPCRRSSRASSPPSREMQWIASVYTLFLGALTLASGSAGDRFGRRRLFAAGLAILTIASVAAGFAADAAQLIAARAGAGHRSGPAGAEQPRRSSAPAFPRSERGRAIGTWSAVTAITGSGGPDPRRRPGRRLVVAIRLLPDRADRAGHARARAHPRARRADRPPAAVHRLGRRGARDDRARRHRLRHHQIAHRDRRAARRSVAASACSASSSGSSRGSPRPSCRRGSSALRRSSGRTC